MTSQEISIVLYGHLCKDYLFETKEYASGSAVWYISQVLQKLADSSPKVISPYGSDYPKEWLGEVPLLPSDPTTEKTLVYQNEYDQKGKRTQHAFHWETALPVKPDKVDAEIFAQAQAMMICPLIDNISLGIIEELKQKSPKALFVLLPQGFYRHIDADGLVTTKSWHNSDQVVPLFKFVIVSEEDGLNMHDQAMLWSETSSTVIFVTQADKGVTLYREGKKLHVPSLPVEKVVHATGAGDVFAAALVTRYLQTQLLEESMSFANVAGALHVSGQTLNPKVIEEKLNFLP